MAKILLVEDDNNLREIYEARLQAEGYEIVSARDGEEALTVAMKERPDLIISDVMMPKISGFDMLDIIRSTEETKNAKVIMMTALSQAEDKERADKLGADRYLVKSQVTLEDVAKVAREVLSGEKQAPKAETAVVAPTEPADAPIPTPVTSTVEPPSDDSSTPTPSEPTPIPVPAPTPTSDDSTQTSTSPATDATAAPAPVPEPAAPTAASPSPSPAPSSESAGAPNSPSADPAPVADDSSQVPANDTTDSPAMAAVAEPVATTTPANDANPQTVEEEQSAIAAQIESFIDTNKKDQPTQAVEAQPNEVKIDSKVPAEEPKTETEAEKEPISEKAEAIKEMPKKKVIKPINDPTASKSQDLEKLAAKEIEKEEMRKIAKDVASQNSDKADEAKAGAELRSAARNDEPKPESEVINQVHVAPEVKINDKGDIEQLNSSSNPEVKSQEPVIPHDKGTSIDGVKQNPSESDAPDPNSIAL